MHLLDLRTSPTVPPSVGCTVPRRPVPGVRRAVGRRAVGHRHRPALPSVAAEHAGAYEVAPSSEPPSDPTAGHRPDGVDRPAVLEELPELASLLDDLAVADRALLAAVARLADLLRSGQVAERTGVDVEHWLASVARQTRMDRRLLHRACRLLHRLPSLDAAVREGRVSFAQLRGLSIALRTTSADLHPELDTVLAAVLAGLEQLERPDPDALVRQVADAADELDAARLADAEQDASRSRHLWLQPRLDGSGGRFGGELDAAGLALLDAATAPPTALLGQPGGLGAARADVLLARLAGPHPRDVGPPGPAPDDVPAAPGLDDPDLAAADLATPDPDDADLATSRSWQRRLDPPKLLLRLSFDALLDERVPGELLTRMLGGRLRLTSAAARALADRRGALLRTVVVDDDGAVIGVGRATRRPPGWLQDSIAAIHDTCTAPGCDRPARDADHDHARPWWPTGPDLQPGTTDVTELGPLCPASNRDKEAAGWKVRQTAAGVRTWHHPRSGLVTTTIPSTWRPPDDPRRRRRPPRPGAASPDQGAGPPRRAQPPAPLKAPPSDLPF